MLARGVHARHADLRDLVRLTGDMNTNSVRVEVALTSGGTHGADTNTVVCEVGLLWL